MGYLCVDKNNVFIIYKEMPKRENGIWHSNSPGIVIDERCLSQHLQDLTYEDTPVEV